MISFIKFWCQKFTTPGQNRRVFHSLEFMLCIHKPVKIIIVEVRIVKPNTEIFLTPIQPIISNICWSNKDKTYPEFAKVFAPLKKIRSWFLVHQLHVFEDGVLHRRKVTSIGHFVN